MGKMISPLLQPRTGSDGTKNYIDLGVDPLTLKDSAGATGNFATIGAWIKDKTENANWPAQDRLYAFDKVEEATFERTETAFETSPSGGKYKLESGGVRTVAFKMYAKNAVNAILRELKKTGCSDVNMLYVASAAIWGVKDDLNTKKIRGFEMASDTFEVFKEYATDTTTAKLNISFDLDSEEVEENAFAVTNEEVCTSQDFSNRYGVSSPPLCGVNEYI
jgi:hypothetical protein